MHRESHLRYVRREVIAALRYMLYAVRPKARSELVSSVDETRFHLNALLNGLSSLKINGV